MRGVPEEERIRPDDQMDLLFGPGPQPALVGDKLPRVVADLAVRVADGPEALDYCSRCGARHDHDAPDYLPVEHLCNRCQGVVRMAAHNAFVAEQRAKSRARRRRT